MNRRQFLRAWGVAVGVITLSPLLDSWPIVPAPSVSIDLAAFDACLREVYRPAIVAALNTPNLLQEFLR